MRADVARLLDLLERERSCFNEERIRWELERRRLIDMIEAKHTGDFIARQNTGKPKPEPIAAVPPEAVKDRPRALGI